MSELYGMVLNAKTYVTNQIDNYTGSFIIVYIFHSHPSERLCERLNRHLMGLLDQISVENSDNCNTKKCLCLKQFHKYFRACIHQAFSRTFFIFFSRFCEFECNKTSDWLKLYGFRRFSQSESVLYSNASNYEKSGEQDQERS